MEAEALTVPAIEQVYYEVDRRSKLEVLCRLIDLEDVKLAIIFCATKMMVDELTEHLIARGYGADKLHGDMTQAMRERVMGRFRKKKVEFLVATDVAARGLDVDDIEIVFNYDLPHDGEDYVHRIGRTGRAGKGGQGGDVCRGARDLSAGEYPAFHEEPDQAGAHPDRGGGGRKTRERVCGSAARDAGEGRIQTARRVARSFSGAGLFADRHRVGADPFVRRRQGAQGRGDSGGSAAAGASREPDPRGRERREQTRDDYERRPSPPPPRRGPREEAGMVSHEPGMVRLAFNAGRAHEVQPGDFVGVIAGVTAIPKGEIGAIHLQATKTLVDVAEARVPLILKKLNGIQFKGRKLLVRVSK